jgi:hypothetical protein
MCLYTLEERKITFDVPVEQAPGVINNSRDHFEFTFNQTFDTGTKQDTVFDAVARPIIDGALEGFNGTIFAYGQTGSGKTFTMTGGQSSFNDRGIIPRTLQYAERCPVPLPLPFLLFFLLLLRLLLFPLLPHHHHSSSSSPSPSPLHPH